MNPNLPEDIPNEILQETIKLVHEMLKDPEIAGKAISDRNIIIKGLKADIEHYKSTFHEAKVKYTETIEKLNEIKDSSEQVKKLTEENKKLTKELTDIRQYLSNSLIYRVDEFLKKIPGFLGTVIRFFLTGPLAKFSFMAMFCMLFIASMTGWGFIANALHPLFKLIGTLVGFGD